MSKFIYTSSEENNIGSNPNADFTVNFHQPLEILPGSEIRVTECRINPKNDVIEINDNNNILAFSIGVPWANEDMGYGSYYKVKLTNGTYLVENGDTLNYLNFHIQEEINKAITNNSLFRGGVEVTVTTAGYLKYKIREASEYYTIPQGNQITEINDILLEICRSFNTDGFYMEIQDITPMELGKSPELNYDGGNDDYYGLELLSRGSEVNFFTSPPLNVFGNQFNTDADLFYIKLDTDNFAENVYTKIDLVSENNKGFFYKSYEDKFTADDLHPGNFLYNILNPLVPGFTLEQQPFNIVLLGNDDDEINVILSYLNKKGVVEIERLDEISKGHKIEIKCQTNTNGNNCEFYLNIRNITTDTDLFDNNVICSLDCFKSINKNENGVNISYNKNSLDNASNLRLAITTSVYNSDVSDEYEDPIYVAFNFDAQNGPGGFVGSAFISRSLEIDQNTNTPTPFVIYGDKFLLNKYQNFINSFDLKPYISGIDLLNNINVNCGSSIGINEIGFMGTATTLATVGLTSVDIINTNSRQNALYFISCDDLPLLNYTGNIQTGSLNRFVYSIDFNSGSGSRNNIYTSKPEIDKYNKLTNTQVLRISNMRLRITNIRGETVENLDDHTYIVFEIRENPFQQQQKLMTRMFNNQQTKQIQNNYLNPATKQFQ